MDIGSLTGRIALEDQLSSHLTTIVSRVKQFASNFTTSMVVSAAGASVLIGAVADISRSILDLGEKGSVIIGVEESFDRLARAAGSTGEALFGGLNEGVKGTIDSMVLMQSTSRLLSSGIKLTADDMRVMGAVSREMGKATGTDAASGLNVLSQAMLTGNIRSLKRFGINVDLVKSEKDFAASLGTTRDELSATGVLEAHRIGIMQAMRGHLDRLGESQLSFKEKLQQSRVAVGNWFDSLAKGVASSTSVGRAFDTIRDALVKTFGGTAESLLQSILGWVDKFADGITSVGPAVIGVIGNIKDSIVAIWNEIVAFNERWQITNNIVAGAKIAWGLLKDAFNLVKVAVVAVIQAWESMPEWLRRITQTALEGSIALAAYSVAIQGVAVPFRAMIGAFDLGINIIGNLTGAIFNVVSMQKMWGGPGGPIDWTTAAYGRLIVALRASTVATVASGVAARATAQAKVFWSGVLFTLGNSIPILTARIWLMEAATAASGLAAKGAAIAKTFFAGVIFALGNSTPILTARIWLMNASLTATGVASRVAAGGMTVLGTVLLLVQSLPIVAILAGFALALTKLKDAWDGWVKARGEGQNFWSYLHNTRDYDNWARQALEYIGLLDEISNAEERRRKRQKGGANLGGSEFLPTISPGALAPGSAEFQAAQAARRKAELRAQGIGLVDEPESSFIKGSTAAEDFAKKVRDQAKAFGEADMGARVFTATFARLSQAQRENYDIQQLLVPEIDKLANAHKPLTAEMIRVRDAALSTRLALLDKDRITLESSGLTLSQIDSLKRLGLTEADIAFQYGVTVEALSRRNVAMQEAAQREQALASFNNALVEQEARARERREALSLAGNKAIADANIELNDLIKQQAMSTTDFQIAMIDREAAERIVAFKGEVEQAAEFNNTILALAEKRKDALFIDNDALKAHSRTTLQAIADKAMNTYREMQRHPEEYSTETRRQFKKIAEEAARSANDTRSAWKKAWDQLKVDVKQIALDLTQGIATSLADGIKTGDWSQFENQFKESLSQAMGSVAASFVNFFVPGLGTALKPVFQAISDKFLGWLGLGTKGRDAIRAFWDAEYGGFAGLQHRLEELGPTGQRLLNELGRVGRDNVKQAEAVIAKIKTELAALDADVQKYNLTWRDLADAQRAVTKSGTDLVATYKRLTGAGYTVDRVTTVMSDDLNQFIVDAVRAGTKIPAAMRPIIETLIKTGKLSDAAAKAILGIADAALPALEDIRGAAERYGITLDELGPKVKQLEINETVTQYVADWKILTAVTDDWSVLFDKMGPKVQSVIDDAIRYSLELPSAMKPMVQAFIEAGRLVDENGEKLTDLSKLTFAADLSEMFETLMTKLDKLIDKISGGLGGALDSLGKRIFRPRIEPELIEPEIVGPDYGGARPSSTAATGGTVYAATGSIVPFKASAAKPFVPTPFVPKGTDTVPAMLTPGEIVLNASQQRGIASTLKQMDDNVMSTVRSMLDDVMRLMVPKITIPLNMKPVVEEIDDNVFIAVQRMMAEAEAAVGRMNATSYEGDVSVEQNTIPRTETPQTPASREGSSREAITQVLEVHVGDQVVRQSAKGLPAYLKFKGVR